MPAAVIAEFAQILKQYKITEVQGDGFAGGFVVDERQRNGIRFKACDNTTSENYLHMLPMLLSGRARLNDNQTLRSQLAGLERKLQPSGHEVVTHAAVSSAHDDIATSAAGALVLAGNDVASRYIDALDKAFPISGEGAAAAWRVASLINHIARYG